MWPTYFGLLKTLAGTNPARLFSSCKSNWCHAHDWSGMIIVFFSKKYKILLTNLLIFVDTVNQGEKDDKIIAVCADDPEYRHYSDIKELPPHRLAEIRRFFEDCILWKLNYYKCLNLYQHFFGRCNIVYLDN